MRNLVFFLTAVIFFCFTQVVSAETVANQLGQLDGNHYTNKFFGFSISLPDGWTSDGPLREALVNKFGSMMVKNSSQINQAMKKYHIQKLRLFRVKSVDRLTMRAGVLSAAAISMPGPTSQMTADEYVQGLLRRMQFDSRAKVSVFPRQKDITIKGVKYATGTVILHLLGEKMKENFLVIKRKGYMLMFIAAYNDEGIVPTLNKSLSTLTFEKQ